MWRPQQPTFSVPYVVVIVELDEGPLLISNLVDYTEEDLAIGTAVTVAFETRGDFLLPVFRPCARQIAGPADASI